jgi:DNA-binding response OmpR family regulator
MKLLIIEDDLKIGMALRQGLEQESYIVDMSNDGEVGYDLASEENYDLIILDLMLPRMNGLEICRKLRSEKNKTPILMLTAKTEVEDRVDGLNSGADDYLGKPFSFDELLARVRALLRRPVDNMQVTDDLIVGDLILNPTSFEVYRSGKKINLSKREFSLLEYLMRNKNKTISKDQIISSIWNFESDILPNTVEVYIGYLRNKVDKPFNAKSGLIKTSRGFGYKIEE